MNLQRMLLHALTGAFVAIAPIAASAADAYPERPIRVIVPFPPGGSNDILSRYMGNKLSERMGQQFIIDNRGGGSGIIGAQMAAEAPNDGHTLLFVSVSWMLNAAVRKLPYDVEKSFDPIALIASAPNCLVVSPNGAYRTLGDLLSAAKAKPGAVNYASTGTGGINHFGGELFKLAAKVNMTHVPYKGGGPAMTDVMGGNVQVMFSSVTQTLPHVRSGRLKILAVGSQERSPVVPDVPTVTESGIPGYNVTIWWGFAAPQGVPKPRMARLLKEMNAVLDEADTKKWLLSYAATPIQITQAAFRKQIHDEIIQWKKVAQQAGIRIK
ncbi:MAG: Bug family tripartite tricarboxylate transporter substrate binding protein [Burkholderiales bacterium]